MDWTQLSGALSFRDAVILLRADQNPAGEQAHRPALQQWCPGLWVSEITQTLKSFFSFIFQSRFALNTILCQFQAWSTAGRQWK